VAKSASYCCSFLSPLYWRHLFQNFLFGFGLVRVFNNELKMTDSQQLLADYVRNGSEEAFRELVTRYLALVHSTAIRLVGGNTHLAEDVAQIVFVDLARKARTLPGDVMLGGWLHRDTCFVAAKTMRSERRRQSRERHAVEMNSCQNHSASDLMLVAPILDEAINQLGAEDRTAILLRFFEQRDLRSVGNALGSNEDAARMRVNRALEKLHSRLKHRGVTLSVAALGTGLAAEAVTAAPAGLAVTISSVALAGAAAGTGTTFTLLKAQIKLREENDSFRQQIAQLQVDNQSLSNFAAQAKNPASLPGDQFDELLRLRGEVGVLRQKTNELAGFRQENRKLLSQVAAQSEPTNQVSAEDQFILRQTHAVDAMTTLLAAIKNYATNHDGQYPGSFEQLAASGDLGTTNFAGNLGLADFELVKDGAVDPQGNKVVLRLRVPLQRPGSPSVMVLGGITDDGVTHTTIMNISSE
jgi:RNA polymerase sigma factor (sigma-70 family)